ncbi:MAG TPA: rhomboid family intramembrane serine protease [Spirochaetota bacterium]|nr:rhomboid family intramembrane serine protease [Spirochaetota bacterium]HPI89075.1 rhomboid family intramembrane serine protease [Spirochaetota bacterium]HPR48714.1 rhomboid family intramembrane serine protease [Spirochaetota bacterium]
MLLPYKDVNPTRHFPFMTIILILANIAVFLYQVFGPYGFDVISRQFALIPYELHKGNLPDSTWIPPFLSLGTYMFLHAGPGHLAFNMLFLWIFGNNIEDRMSPFSFLVFYLLTGVISALAFEAIFPGSDVNLVGASGAISAVLGAYLFLFPRAQVHALLFIFPVRMSALVFLIIWFIMQISGFLGQEGSVAWISHITGFVSGIILHRFFLKRR